MSSWEQLDSFLEGLTRQLGGDAYLFAERGKLTLSPPNDLPENLMSRFERAFSAVAAAVGRESVRRGSWKRHFSHDEENWFVAEPVLGSYHLIVLFESDHTSDAWIVRGLDKARPALEALVSGLPPLDGGCRAGEMKLSS